MNKELELRPSASKRWMGCNASVFYDLTLPNTTSDEAERGTFLHKIAEECLSDDRQPLDFLDNEDDAKLVKQYLDFVLDKSKHLSHINSLPGPLWQPAVDLMLKKEWSDADAGKR